MKRILCTVLGVVAVLMAGCRREAAQPLSDLPPLLDGVARVEATPIRREDLELELTRRGARRDDADFDAVVEELIQRQLIVADARRLGLDEEPATRRALDAVLIARWKERQLEPLFASNHPVASVSAASATNDAPAPAARLEPVSHVAWLRLRFTPRTSTARRDALRERMAEARSRALQLEPAVVGFGPLAVDYSDDDDTRSIGGDLGWLSASGSSIPGGDSVRKAIDALREPGEISPVIEARDGFYLIRLIERRESSARGNAARQEAAIASHRAQIERRRAIEQSALAGLRERLRVEYHSNELEEVRSAWRSSKDRRGNGPSGPAGEGRP